jgi:hypothetical protein
MVNHSYNQERITMTYTIIGANSADLDADARLIAAAPDLLAALEWWQAQMRDDNCDDMGKLLDDMSAKAHAAIAKAKGN